MLKKPLLIPLITLVLCLFGFTTLSDGVENAGFEMFDETGFPIGWSLDAYNDSEEACSVSTTKEFAYSGEFCIRLENSVPNDSRLEQRVSCLPNKIYCFSAYVMVENIGADSAGANLSVQGDGKRKYYNTAMSADITGTSGEWQQLKLYIKTGPDVTHLFLWLRLGGFSMDNNGVAYFDQVEFTEVSSIPEGAYISTVGLGDDEPIVQEEGNPVSNETTEISFSDALPLIIIIICLGLLIGVIYLRSGRVNNKPKVKVTKNLNVEDDDI